MKTVKAFWNRLCVFTFLAVVPAAFCAVPVINGFNPTSGSPGTSMTISGSNFGALPADNIIYFGPVRAAITSASPTNIVVTVPHGAMYAPITVTVGGLVAYSIAPFKPTFSGSGAAFDGASFASRVDLAVPSGPTRLAIADLNNDGKPDLVVASIYAHQITILENISTSGSLDTNSFAAPVYIPFVNSAQSPYWIVAGDVDGDGKIDLIAPDEAGNRILVYRNISTGGPLTTNSFAAPVAFNVGMSPRNIAIRDLDGDGRPDLAVANVGDQTVSILKNVGIPSVIDTNTFAPQFVLQAGSMPHDLTIGDLDGDGKPDLAVNNYTSPYVSLFRNVSVPGVLDTNSFEAPVLLPAPLYCNSVVLGDLDGDGRQDLLIGTAQGYNEVSVYRNMATPGPLSTNSFSPEFDFPAVGWVNTVAVGDLNGDGKLDVALVDQMSSTFSVFQNVGTGSFDSGSLASRVDYVSGNDPIGLSIVDLDGDGRPDVIFGNTYDSSLSIYRNNDGSGAAPVIVSQPTNQTASVGGTVTFSVEAVGSAPLAYQWWGPVGQISNATNSFLTLANVQTNDAGAYLVVVTNLYGSTMSSNAVLTVGSTASNASPLIVTQPSDQTASVGGSATFSVTATGSPTLFYQWYFGASRIPGALSHTLTLSNVQPGDAGNYSVLVSNLYGFAASSNAVLTVTVTNGSGACVPPATGLAAWWPAEGNGNDIVNGNTAILESGVTFGAGKVGQAFQLQNPTNAFMRVPASPSLNVGTGSGLTIEGWINVSSVAGLHPIAEWHGGARDVYGAQFWLNSNPFQSGALLGALPDTNGNQHTLVSPEGVLAPNVFQHVALTYDRASGMGILYVNGAVVAQANFGSFVPQTTYDLWIGHRPFDVPGDWTYQADLGGTLDELSIYSRSLTAGEIAAIYNAGSSGKCPPSSSGTAPAITSQPTNQTVTAGGTASFSVTATGSPTLYYQWYFGGGTFISSSTSPTLTLSNVQPGNAGNYYVIVTNLNGSATSSNAVLTVNAAQVTCTPAPSGLVSWWKAEGNAIDSVGGNDGILSNGVGFAAGEVGQGFLFTQTNQAVKVPASSSLDVGVGGGLTLEAWINPSDVTKPDPIFEWNPGDGMTYWGVHLYVLPTGDSNAQTGFLYTDVQDSGDGWHQLQSSDTVITANSLQHVALTYDKASGVARLYRNGTVVAETTFGSFTPKTTGNLNIGNRPTDPANQSFTFAGVIDEPSVYNRALASNEIAAIYNAGSSGKCDPLPAAPTITSQPGNRTVTVGGTATFSVVATGTQPLHYQWTGPDGIISNAITSSLTLNNIQLSDAGNYHVLVSNVYGSTNSSDATLTVNPGIAAIRVINTRAPGGSAVDVPITILANGNENGLSFSLSFDPTRLVYSGVSLGSGASNALILPNVSQAGSGKVGIQLALPSGETFSSGTQELVRVTFNTPVLTGSQSVVTPVSFTSLPIAKLLSDALGRSLPANFVNGTVTLSTSLLEGDAAPLPTGNGSVDLFDWVQVGRFVAGLDTITNGLEFQKVDCAPRDTLGDGQLKVTDWVQAGRYAAGLDPLTVAGGPTNLVTPAMPNALPTYARQVILTGGSAVKGMTITLPVTLEAQGDETALAFSLNFNPKILQYVGTVKGSDASAAVLNVNSNQVASGQLALVLGLPVGGSPFTAGEKEIAKVTFVAIASATNNAVDFADQPVLRSISDVNATELLANYVGKSVVINPQPQIKMSVNVNSSVLSWPAWAGDFGLQAASSLTPPINWTNVPVTFQTNGDNIEITLPAGSQQTFFRLYHP